MNFMNANFHPVSMTNTYHAKRQRASSVPGDYRSTIASNVQSHSDSARTSTGATRRLEHDIGGLEGITAAFAPRSEEQVAAPPIPQWQRELAVSRVGRHSRASSIISTRTRLTVQSDDARSIDFEAGGQSFRISRDGSSITNTTAPPPYPGPPLDEVAEEVDEDRDEDDSSGRLSSDTLREEQSPTIQPQDDRTLRSLPLRTHIPTTPSDDESPAAVDRRTSSPFELPRRFRQVLNMSWYSSPSQSESSKLASSATTTRTPSLRRTQSDSSSLANFNLLKSETSKPAGQQQQLHHKSNSADNNIAEYSGSQPTSFLSSFSLPQSFSQSNRTSTHHSTTEDERIAEVSAHYTRLLRSLDRDHRTRLHERDTELARLRQLLNEKDIVYRQQLRERDHVIEGLRSQMRHRDIMINEVKTRAFEMEEEFDVRLEKARNEVEDMWEARWKEYEAILRERLGIASGGSIEIEVTGRRGADVIPVQRSEVRSASGINTGDSDDNDNDDDNDDDSDNSETYPASAQNMRKAAQKDEDLAEQEYWERQQVWGS